MSFNKRILCTLHGVIISDPEIKAGGGRASYFPSRRWKRNIYLLYVCFRVMENNKASPRYALENVCYQLNKHFLVPQSQYTLFSIYNINMSTHSLHFYSLETNKHINLQISSQVFQQSLQVTLVIEWKNLEMQWWEEFGIELLLLLFSFLSLPMRAFSSSLSMVQPWPICKEN